MEQFAERLSQLADLSPDDLEALETELVAAFDEADAAADVEAMQQLADALDQVRGVIGERAGTEEAAAPADSAEAPTPAPAAEPVAASAEAPAAETTEEASTDAALVTDAEPEAEASATETETETAEVETADPEAPATDEAAATQTDPENHEEGEVEPLTAADTPEENAPTAVQAAAPIIRVGGDIPGFTAGAQLSSYDEAIEAMTAKVNSMRGIGGDGEHVLVASIGYDDEVPEDRILRPGDANGNGRKIRQVLENRELLTAEALTATAGWCAPKAPVYDVPTVGTTARPIRDGLPSFTADRGGIVWMEPPSLGAVKANDADTFAVWDGETDKPCFTIECGDEATAELDALTMCLCFNNLMARAFPEWIRANTDLTMVAQARWAERYLLGKMWTGLTTGTSSGSVQGTPDIKLGAARDFLTALRLIAANFRWVNRLDRTQPLQLVAPSWLLDAILSDLALQQPGDNTISVSEGEVAGYLSDINVQPLWFIDDLPTGSGATPASSQDSRFDSRLGYPDIAEWLLYPTGTFVRLDGGSLDLGIVRTKEDVQQNKYCEFSETFETLAYMGPANPNGWAIRGRTAIDIIGGTAASISTSAGTIGS